MATNKLLMRIVTPEIGEDQNGDDIASKLHAYTHGINSDPLTLMAIVFSALIHDGKFQSVDLLVGSKTCDLGLD